MKYKGIVLFLIAILLAACSSQATPPANTSVPASATSATTGATIAATDTSAAAPTQDLTPLSGVVTFIIVPDESTASYQVGETFINRNNAFNLAVGTTGQVSGQIQANLDNPPASTIGEIQVDMSQFKSDSNMRDQRIRSQFLESSKYPMAVFDPTSISGLPDSFVEGQSYNFQVTGNLTVHQVTKAVTFDMTASLQNDTLSGIATATVLLSDFGVGPISLLGILETQDQAILTLDFVARP